MPETKNERRDRLVKTTELDAINLTIDEQYDRIRYLTIQAAKVMYPSLGVDVKEKTTPQDDNRALRGTKQVFSKDWND